jgi:hypothetical protein
MEQRVKRGMAVLDHFSPDWEFRVRPEQVTSIKDASKCILCGVFGTYARGLHTVGMICDSLDDVAGVKGRMILDCGFCPTGFGLDTSDDEALTAAWQAAIRERIQDSTVSAYERVFEEGFA